MDIDKLIKDNLPPIQNLWHQLHHNPELAFKEYNTHDIIVKFLNDFDIKGTSIANTGYLATIGSEIKCLGIRADMDAIPVDGVNHCCGHDFHMAIVAGTALILKQLNISKTVKFIFQPAEESIGGATHIIQEGGLKNPEVEAIIGFHVWPTVPVGKIELAPGPTMAAVDDFIVTFKGKGGHAAMPHLCKNPLYPAMDFINKVTIKSRIENNTLNPHVITFPTLICGGANNVIDETAEVRCTMRTFDKKFRPVLRKMVEDSAKLSAESYGCEVDIETLILYPAVHNDEKLTKTFSDVTASLIGRENILPLEKTFAAEDFSYYCNEIPSVHFRLGIFDGEKGSYPLHSPNFSGSLDSLYWGIYILTNFILNY